MNFFHKTFRLEEELELEELLTKIPDIDSEIQVCRKKCSEFWQDLKEQQKESHETNTLIANLNYNKEKLLPLESTLDEILREQLTKAEDYHEHLINKYDETSQSLLMIRDIEMIHENLDSLKRFYLNVREINEAIDVANTLKLSVKTLSPKSQIPFVVELEKMVYDEVEKLNSILREQFHKYCIMVHDNNESVLKISSDEGIKSSLFSAVYRNANTSKLMIELSEFMLQFIFLPTIKCNTKIIFEDQGNMNILTIKIMNAKDNIPYENVYDKIQEILKFLTKYLHFSIDNDLKLLYFMGNHIKKHLAKALLEECIMKSIPKDWKTLIQFKCDLVNSTKNIENQLRPINFFDDELNCIYQMEKFYGQNRCLYFNDRAREIMKKDLHNFVEVGTADISTESLKFQFPRCAISSSAVELIKLGKELITELLQGPVDNRKALFATYKGIFFNYGDFIATYHQKFLETIPQQVALFYNNCEYLFQQLSEWNEAFENDNNLKELCDDSSREFYQVQEVGKLFFNSFVEEQKKQIENILKETNLHSKRTLNVLEDNVEKLTRQCLRQQELLKTVWSKVLPHAVYNEIMGNILNTLCNFFVDSLLQVEDIEASVADCLIEIFKIILNRGPKLFTDHNEVSLYVHSWQKFNELIFILGASLLDINDRWADGKGPLVLQFKPFEMKQLIRALFQNTERRALVLSRIREN